MNTAHCGGCGRGWSGLSAAHCGNCHAHFSTVANFDAHKPNRRLGCGDPATMTRTKPRTGEVVPVFKLSRRPGPPTWIGYADNPLYAEKEAPDA
jgi:hypothetical protein